MAFRKRQIDFFSALDEIDELAKNAGKGESEMAAYIEAVDPKRMRRLIKQVRLLESSRALKRVLFEDDGPVA
jgi:hypothetical protein